MTTLLSFSNQLLALVQIFFILAGVAGTVAIVKAQKKIGIIKVQNETIQVMQQQINALKEQNTQQQKKIDHQDFEIQAMREALKDEGILITIDGEKVTIKTVSEPDTTRHIIRRPTKVVKKIEDQQERKDTNP